MPRRPRIIVPRGVPHYITHVHSAKDLRLYLKTLDDEARGHGVRILAWCLMTKHVHLIRSLMTPNRRRESWDKLIRSYALAFNPG